MGPENITLGPEADRAREERKWKQILRDFLLDEHPLSVEARHIAQTAYKDFGEGRYESTDFYIKSRLEGFEDAVIGQNEDEKKQTQREIAYFTHLKEGLELLRGKKN